MNVTWGCWAFSLEDFLEEGDQTLREDALPQAAALGRGKSSKWSQVTLCHFSSSHSQRDQTREGSLVHILLQPITGTQIRTQNRSSYHGLRSEPRTGTQIRTKNKDSDQQAGVFRLRGELSPHNPLHPSAHNLKALMVNCPLFSYKGKSRGQPPYLNRYIGNSSG